MARIDNQVCIGCTQCIRACPVDAIVGAPRHQHHVLADRCTGCDQCIPPCPVDCIHHDVVIEAGAEPYPDWLLRARRAQVHEVQRGQRLSRQMASAVEFPVSAETPVSQVATDSTASTAEDFTVPAGFPVVQVDATQATLAQATAIDAATASPTPALPLPPDPAQQVGRPPLPDSPAMPREATQVQTPRAPMVALYARAVAGTHPPGPAGDRAASGDDTNRALADQQERKRRMQAILARVAARPPHSPLPLKTASAGPAPTPVPPV